MGVGSLLGIRIRRKEAHEEKNEEENTKNTQMYKQTNINERKKRLMGIYGRAQNFYILEFTSKFVVLFIISGFGKRFHFVFFLFQMLAFFKSFKEQAVQLLLLF